MTVTSDIKMQAHGARKRTTRNSGERNARKRTAQGEPREERGERQARVRERERDKRWGFSRKLATQRWARSFLISIENIDGGWEWN